MEAQGFVSKNDQLEKAVSKEDMRWAQGSGGTGVGLGNMIRYLTNSER
jgi:hypothetical protein